MPGSPASEAQVQRGDVIQKFDGHDVRNIAELQRLVSQLELNKKVDLQVERKGKPVTLATTIKERPANYGLARALPPGGPGRQPPSLCLTNPRKSRLNRRPMMARLVPRSARVNAATCAATGRAGQCAWSGRSASGFGGRCRPVAGRGCDRGDQPGSHRFRAGLRGGPSVTRPESAAGPFRLPATQPVICGHKAALTSRRLLA